MPFTAQHDWEQIDPLIDELYRNGRPRIGALTEIANRFDLKPRAIHHRVQILRKRHGRPYSRRSGGDAAGRAWTEQEEAYLKDAYCRVPMRVLCQHLNRNAQSITRRAYLLDLDKYVDGWTIRDVANGLGTTERQVTAWIRQHWLDARIRTEGKVTYYISDQALHAFLVRYPSAWSMNTVVDQAWVIALLSDKKLVQERKDTGTP